MRMVLARDWHHSRIAPPNSKATSIKVLPKPMRSSTTLFAPSKCGIFPRAAAVVAQWNGERSDALDKHAESFSVRSGLADLFDLPEEKIRVIGSKSAPALAAKTPCGWNPMPRRSR